MAKQFRVPVKIIFEGYVIVKSDSKINARNNVKKNFKGLMRNPDNLYNDAFIGWNIPIHSSETTTGHITIEE